MNNKRKFFLIFAFIILDALLLIGYLVINDKTNKTNLEKEIKYLEKLDASKDRYNRKIKTTGEYAKVEKTIKKYLDKYAKDYQNVLSSMKDEKLIKILSYENMEKDGFEFNESLNYLKDKKENINKKIDSLIEKSSKEEMTKYLNKNIKDTEYKDLAIKLMISKNMIKSMDKNKEDLSKVKEKINKVIDTSNEVLTLLKDNKDICSLEDKQVKIKSKQVFDKYNELINKIKEG